MALHEECGVFGIYGAGEPQAVQAVQLGLYALQHRGQQSCGIAVSDMGVLRCATAMGRVSEALNATAAGQRSEGAQALAELNGQLAIGHVRYATAKESLPENSQPLVLHYAKGRLAIAYNGQLGNAQALRNQLAETGAMFQTSTDAELIGQLVARERVKSHSIEQAVLRAMPSLSGAYSLVMLSPRKLVAARDPHGIRPLCIGKLGERWVIASESCALDAVHAQFVRDVEPGEVVVVDGEGLHSLRENCQNTPRVCIFEYIYFARPDSVIDGVCVHDSRVTAGRLLARQYPVEADIVIPVPDSSTDAALGYAQESGLPFEMGFMRNNYVGRTFIMPTQKQRRRSVDIKLSVIADSVRGKRVVLVDDSIVRGTTCQNIIRNLKKAGAKEVHVRISSPTLHWPCPYGTDIPTKDELTSNHSSVEELREFIGAQSLGFLKRESLCELMNAEERCFCDACFTGEYPV